MTEDSKPRPLIIPWNNLSAPRHTVHAPLSPLTNKSHNSMKMTGSQTCSEEALEALALTV